MTDFIHEHPKEAPTSTPQPKPKQEEIPLDEKMGQKRVYGYIFILFIVAFSLLLWAFFVNQRSTDEVLSELRGNADTLQTTLDRNIALEEQNEALEKEVERLEKQSAEQEQAVAAMTQERDAWQNRSRCYELMYEANVYYEAGEYDRCRGILDEVEQYLPLFANDVPAEEGIHYDLPEQYNKLREAVG